MLSNAIAQIKSSSFDKKMEVIDNSKVVQEKLQSARLYINSNPNKAIQLIEEALSIAIDNYDQKGQADAYFLLGEVNTSLEEYRLAKINYLKAKDVYSIVKDNNGNYQTIKKLSSTYERLGEVDNAISFYQSYYALAQKAGYKNDELEAQQGIARMLSEQGEYEAAETIVEQVMSEESAPRSKKAEANLQMGKLKQAQKSEEEAIIYYQESQRIAEDDMDAGAVNEAFDSQYSLYQSAGNSDKQLEVKEKALDYNKKNQNINEQLENTIDIGELYLNANKPDEAIEYLQQGIELSGASDNLASKSRALEVLSKAYDEIGETEQALSTYKEYLSLETILNQRKEEELKIKVQRGRLLEKTQSEVVILEKNKELNEKTIELLKKEKSLNEAEIGRQKILIYALIAGLIIVLISFLLIMKSAREKRIAHQLLMLKSLRSQMNPHFIFNALNSVNNFISKSDERAANKYLSDFSKLMRQVLDNSHEDFVSLAVELEILELYTKLEHFRFKDKFDYEFIIDENIDSEAFVIPPMLIQPYIENAVWHGLRYKEEKGFLSIKVYQNNNDLIITIEDDGIGRQKSIEIKTKNQKAAKSLGMKNIRERLEIINKVYNIHIAVDINDCKSTDGVGTKVIVKIPEYNNIKN